MNFWFKLVLGDEKSNYKNIYWSIGKKIVKVIVYWNDIIILLKMDNYMFCIIDLESSKIEDFCDLWFGKLIKIF